MITTYTVTTVSLFILPSLWGKLCREYEDAKKLDWLRDWIGLDWSCKKTGLVMYTYKHILASSHSYHSFPIIHQKSLD
jgi:hypothetical protein